MWRNLSLSRNSTSIFKRCTHLCTRGRLHVVCRTRDSLAIFSVSLKMSARHRGTFSTFYLFRNVHRILPSLSLSLSYEKNVLTSVQFCFVSIWLKEANIQWWHNFKFVYFDRFENFWKFWSFSFGDENMRIIDSLFA